MAEWSVEPCKGVGEKKGILSYQQSFRIDDLLTRRAIEQQPDHFGTISSPRGGRDQDSTTRDRSPPLEKQNGYSSQKNCEHENKKRDSTSGNDDDDDHFRKRKKARTAFSREQVGELEKKFQEKKYLSSAERGELAERLKLSDMQVKTWFQNRRMKYKRQSEEAEMEMKSPKYPYGSFVSYGSVTPFYSYMPMPYKPENGMHYTYASTIRSPQTPSATVDASFPPMSISSPTMLGSLPSPLSIPQRPPTPHLPRPNPTASYFSSNGVLTPLSPPTSYQQTYFSSDNGILSGHVPPQMHFSDWHRTIPTPPTP